MKHLTNTSQCPVCEMTNIDPSVTLIYQGVEQAFCSSRCRERFKKHPHLFVGDPRHGPSEKQKGKLDLKARVIVLKDPLAEESKATLSKKITGLMGVIEVDVFSRRIRVKYDLLQISLTDIEKAIIEVLGDLKTGAADKLKRAYIHYTEECELDNLGHLTKDSGYGQ